MAKGLITFTSIKPLPGQKTMRCETCGRVLPLAMFNRARTQKRQGEIYVNCRSCWTGYVSGVHDYDRQLHFLCNDWNQSFLEPMPLDVEVI